MIRDLFGAVGRWWVRIQDVVEAQQEVERCDRLLSQTVEARIRAEEEAGKAVQKYADLFAAADPKTKHAADTIGHLRLTVDRQNVQIRALQQERDDVVRRWRAADQALTLAEVAPRFDTHQREADQHRRNAIALADRNAELRRAKDAVEAEARALEAHVAELIGLLEKCGREHR